ncbi:hypothetical protein L6452_10899 [Arctium lappa]|uniref:Uncharacterized protein n=1 Tax=Arctium lappa TaxID=4217 RepID=A0ACB9DNL4_ARCLA|nr:hypothetical protein L6452_10899 [Arctium lappa]
MEHYPLILWLNYPKATFDAVSQRKESYGLRRLSDHLNSERDSISYHQLSSQILAKASQCLESMDGVKEGKWKATPLVKVLKSYNIPSVLEALPVHFQFKESD